MQDLLLVDVVVVDGRGGDGDLLRDVASGHRAVATGVEQLRGRAQDLVGHRRPAVERTLPRHAPHPFDSTDVERTIDILTQVTIPGYRLDQSIDTPRRGVVSWVGS